MSQFLSHLSFVHPSSAPPGSVPVPLTRHFDKYALCADAASYVSVSSSFVESSSVADAIAFADSRITDGFGFPSDTVSAHVRHASEFGLLDLFSSLQPALRVGSLQPYQVPSPVPPVPVLPILSCSDYAAHLSALAVASVSPGATVDPEPPPSVPPLYESPPSQTFEPAALWQPLLAAPLPTSIEPSTPLSPSLAALQSIVSSAPSVPGATAPLPTSIAPSSPLSFDLAALQSVVSSAPSVPGATAPRSVPPDPPPVFGVRGSDLHFQNLLDPRPLSPTAQRNYIALYGGPVLLHPSFVPNGGVGVHPLPADIAPPQVLEAHMAASIRLGKAVLLPLELVQSLCASEKIPFHVSNPFVTEKLDAVLMRLICDYTNSLGNGLNHPDKSPALSSVWGPIRVLSAADLAQLLHNARDSEPGQQIFLYRVDIADAFARVLMQLTDISLCALLVMWRGVPHVFLPLLFQFGNQDANFLWNLVTVELLNRAHIRSHREFHCQRSSACVDDFLGAGSYSSTLREIAAITADAESVVAVKSVKPSKTLHGQRIEVYGYDVDTSNLSLFTLGVSVKQFSKMFNVLFQCASIPSLPSVGDVLPMATVQSLSANMIRIANLIPSLLPFSRGFAAAMSGVHFKASFVPLTRRVINDIWMWRATFYCALKDARWLSVPSSRPLLFRRLPLEDTEARASRQASQAHYVVFGDACTTNNGIGVYIPQRTWLMTAIPQLTAYYDVSGTLVPADINLLEFIAAIMAVACLLRDLTLCDVPISAKHIHVWTDNSSCKAWMTKYCSSHPLHCFLLQVFGLLQTSYNIVVTTGHIKGSLNIYADAPSRAFNCPNGLLLRQFLETLPRSPVCQPLLATVLRVAAEISLSTCQTLAASLTLLDEIMLYVSSPSTVFL